jgi:hypothetical protein
VPVEAIETRIRAAGYRLIAPPRQKGNIYLAEVEDSKSVRHRLLYDANDGHLLQNTPLGPVKKPGGPSPSETGKAPKGPEPDRAGKTDGPKEVEPADQAKAVSPPPPPHADEPAPPAPGSTGEGK